MSWGIPDDLDPRLKASARATEQAFEEHFEQAANEGWNPIDQPRGPEGRFLPTPSIAQWFDDWGEELDELAEVHDMTRDELETELQSELSRIVEDTHVSIRMYSEQLESAIEDGVITNAFGGGEDPGIIMGSMDIRKKVESEWLGVPEDAPAEDRPVYGYLQSNDPDGNMGSSALSSFGRVEVRLKQSVNERATFNVGDSIGNNYRAITDDQKMSSAPSPLTDPGIQSLHEPTAPTTLDKLRNTNSVETITGANNPSEYGSGQNYVEAQVRGEIPIDEIDTVVLPFRDRNEELIAALEDAGITVEVRE